MLVGSRLLAQRHLCRRAPTSTPALAILDHPIPWSRLELLAALPVTATAIYALAGVTLASPDRVGCVNAFMQLAGTRGASRRVDRVGVPCLAGP